MNLKSVMDVSALEDVCLSGSYPAVKHFMEEAGGTIKGENISINAPYGNKKRTVISSRKAIFCKVKERGHFLLFIKSKPDEMIRHKWEFVEEHYYPLRSTLMQF